MEILDIPKQNCLPIDDSNHEIFVNIKNKLKTTQNLKKNMEKKT